MPESLDCNEEFSLPSLQISLPQVSTYNHGGPFLDCLCVCKVCMQTHTVCVWSMPYMSYVTYVGSLNKYLYTYIYTALPFFPPPHTVMEVFLKNE